MRNQNAAIVRVAVRWGEEVATRTGHELVLAAGDANGDQELHDRIIDNVSVGIVDQLASAYETTREDVTIADMFFCFKRSCY